MTTSIKKILCSVGMHSNCGDVLEQATNIALSTGGHLHILHVAKPFSDDMINTLKVNIRDRSYLDSLMEQRIDDRRSELSKKIQVACGRHPSLRKAMQEHRVTQTVLEGYPASVITHFASRGGFDMIVMAANRQSHIASYIGKVTKGVIKRAKIPVLVVPTTR